MVPGLAACSSRPTSVTPSQSGAASPSVTSTVTSTASADVCAVIPSSTVAAAFGASVRLAEAGNFLSNPTCNYALDASNIGVTGTVQVINLVIYNAQKYETAKQTGMTGGDADVPGVADGAYYDPHTTAAVLHKGDTVYFVGAAFSAPVGTALDAAKIKADVIALAKTVAGKL